MQPESPQPASVRGRRASQASLLPLVAICVGFFLPTLRGCSHMESPLENVVRSGETVIFVYPYFFAAAALLVLLVGLARGVAPVLALKLIGGVACVGAVACSLGAIDAVLHEPEAVVFLAIAWVCTFVAVRLAWRARRAHAWESCPTHLACITAGTLVSPVMALLLEGLIEDLQGRSEVKALGCGAYVFFAAVLALAVASAWGMVEPRRS